MPFEVPGYQITDELSETAVVKMYRGQRSEDGNPVRLKVLNQPHPTPKLLAPLWQEFEILRLLDFPGVEKALALETHDQWWMMVLEDLGGQSIDRLELAGCMEPKDFLTLALQLVEILSGIHARRVLHKNISPSNISLSPSTHRATFTNFERASLISKEKAPLQSSHTLAETLAYISPELTGRINRTVDYRTDYYSLGATLYELLTGSPPFNGTTALGLIHAHLAIPPEPPASRMQPWRSSPVAFEIISAILLKLLAKNPEDRYQTPSALQADLRHCLSALDEPIKEGSENHRFVAGQSDRPVELNIPQKMFGRERETESLVQAFLRIIDAPKEVVLVTGEEGVGKTTLINQLIPTVTQHNGLFLHAKIEQAHFYKEVYPIFIELMDEFCRQILSEPASSFSRWREKVQSAVAPHGQILIDICPQIEQVIGLQPPVEPVGEESVRLRFHEVVNRFLQAICQPEHPVVIFVDDLHGMNPDSYLLWKSILTNPQLKNLLVVGVIREKESDPENLLYGLAEDLEAAHWRVTRLHLDNLEPVLIQNLIADALGCDPVDISELASLVYQKTEGNPHFTKEFLISLSKDQLLYFDPDEQKWQWEANQIDEYAIANNVVDFFVHEIVNLNQDIQETLQAAALIGRRFNAAILLALFGLEKANILAVSLRQAVDEGLIYPLDENYRFLTGKLIESGVNLPGPSDLLEEQILFEFQHDRIQQAALSMLDERQIESISLQIGWLLLEKAERTGREALQDNLLDIVNHLNKGHSLIERPAGAIKAAQLNLMASNQARAAGAFEGASRYLATGMQFLSENSWQDQYELTLELFTASAEVAVLNGDLAVAEALAISTESNARTLLEKVRLTKIRMDLYMIQNLFDRVIELGIAAIEMLGFDLEAGEPAFSSVEKSFNLPEMTEPRALAVSRLIEILIAAAYVRNMDRFVQLVRFFIDMFSRLGNPPAANFIYLGYGILLITREEKIEQGHRIARMALELAQKQGPSSTLYSIRFVYYAHIHHWLAPASECLAPLEENVQPAFASGNLTFSAASQDLAVQNSLFTGLKLEQVWSKHSEALQRVETLKQTGFTQRLRIWGQVVLKLRGEQNLADDIFGDLFTRAEAQTLLEAGQSNIQLFNLFVAHSFLSLLFRKPLQALETCEAAHALQNTAWSQLIHSHHLFYYSLALLSAELDASGLTGRLEKVEENLRVMRLRAGLVPQNFLHHVELVEAERARCLGRKKEAASGYELAIRDARENGYIHESALAAELAAEYYLVQGDSSIAKDHLIYAYYSYLTWGAQAKVQDLLSRHPEWLPPGENDKTQEMISPVKDRLNGDLASTIDLHSILKASMELAQETNLEELLRKLMVILIENAGAQTGSLILYQNDRWFLKVRGSGDVNEGFAILSNPIDYLSPRDEKSDLPISIIHYVINLKTDLVLEDASATRQFSQDPYVKSRGIKSILCAPLLNQGGLSGLIYLENNLTTGAFTSDRLEVVRLIAGQAAVSIEKARLYETLETQVEDRTRDLLDANRRLKMEIDERIRFEKALRMSEDRYRTMFDSTGTAMAVIDENGFITLFNEKYVQLTGYSREELENHFNSLNIVSPMDMPRIERIQQDTIANPILLPYSFEFKLVDKAGLEKAVIATTTFLPGTRSIIASLIDITPRKRAEEAMRYNEALLRRVLDILPVGVWILDKNSRVIKGNPEAYRIWSGARFVEWTEYDEYKAWRLDTGERISAEDWAARRAIADGEITIDEELGIEAFDGTHRIILNSAIPLATEQDGLIGAIAVNEDITERKRAEEELQTAHDQLSTLLDISQSIVSTLDLDKLLNLIIEQLGKVLPYEAASILILEQDILRFRVIRESGQPIFQDLLNYQIPVQDSKLVESVINGREGFYLPDLRTDEGLLSQIRDALNIPYSQIAFLRSWLGLPLLAKDSLVGFLVLAHSRPDAYSAQLRLVSKTYANQVAIAIHNAQLYRQTRDSAALDERNRLARELHDSVAQTLYSISLFIDATRMAMKGDKKEVIINHLEELNLLSREAMSDMRLLIFELRPPVLEQVGLATALHARLDSVEARSGFQAHFESEGEFHLTPDQEVELYRIAQEALNNVIKHAQANQVSVNLVGEPDRVRMTIEDDGVGFEPEIARQEGGQGFRNMRERAARIGAKIWFESTPGKGSKITIEMKQ